MSFSQSRKDIGSSGEQVACEFLGRKGYTIISRNFRKPWGEIDIVALKDNTMRFVEVKTISSSDSSGFSREIEYIPEELVHASKLRKVARTASLYMEEKKDKREYQIDVVGVILNPATRMARCRLFEQVLE